MNETGVMGTNAGVIGDAGQMEHQSAYGDSKYIRNAIEYIT